MFKFLGGFKQTATVEVTGYPMGEDTLVRVPADLLLPSSAVQQLKLLRPGDTLSVTITAQHSEPDPPGWRRQKPGR